MYVDQVHPSTHNKIEISQPDNSYTGYAHTSQELSQAAFLLSPFHTFCQ